MTERILMRQLHSSTGFSRNRSAFTLLEMLVVIGVILVLTAIAVLALGKLNNGSSNTKAALENCRAMLTEFEGAGGDITQLGGVTTNPGNVNPGQANRTTAVNKSRDVFAQLLRTPKNTEAMGKVPSKMQMATDNAKVMIMTDAWKNPIIFVPQTTNFQVNLGVKSNSGGPDTYAQQGVTIRSQDRRPFFASAGPDGDFLTGDDNMYSFEN